MIRLVPIVFAIGLALLLLAGCGSASQPAVISTTPTLPAGISKITKFDKQPAQSIGQFTPIHLQLNVYILDDQQQVFSSQRTAVEVNAIQMEANAIWSQAGIQFNVSEIRRITVPLDMTGNIIRRQFYDFFESTAALKNDFDPSAPISGFFVQTVKGDNGLHPTRFNAYFIADETLNAPGRTVAHELGHILGLGHTPNDPTQLMHSGSNGINLTSDEIALARSNAKKLK